MADVSFDGLLVVAAIAVAAPIVVATVPGLRRIPAVVVEILAGIAVGPAGFGWVEPDTAISVLALVGLAFLLFLAGLELVAAVHQVQDGIGADHVVVDEPVPFSQGNRAVGHIHRSSPRLAGKNEYRPDGAERLQPQWTKAADPSSRRDDTLAGKPGASGQAGSARPGPAKRTTRQPSGSGIVTLRPAQ